MRATLPMTPGPEAQRCAGAAVSFGLAASGLRRGLCLPLGVLAACAVLASAGAARADVRGACVEVSFASVPTAAPLALDEERAAWVTGTWLLAHAEGERGGNPAWCELGDDAQCDPASPAPSRSESATSSDVGVAYDHAPPGASQLRKARVQHPPIDVAGEAEGPRALLERPPRLA